METTAQILKFSPPPTIANEPVRREAVHNVEFVDEGRLVALKECQLMIESSLHQVIEPGLPQERIDTAELAILQDDAYQPLSRIDVNVLGAGLLLAIHDREFCAGDVLYVLRQYRVPPPSASAVYDSIVDLEARGFIRCDGMVLRPGAKRPSQSYRLTESGETALRTTILHSVALKAA